MTRETARDFDWETWPDGLVNAGYEVSQPDIGAAGNWPITVSPAGSADMFLPVHMSIAPDLIPSDPDADGRSSARGGVSCSSGNTSRLGRYLRVPAIFLYRRGGPRGKPGP